MLKWAVIICNVYPSSISVNAWKNCLVEYLWFQIENPVFVDGDYSMCLHKQEQEAVVKELFWSNVIHLVLQSAVQGCQAWRSLMQTEKLIFVLVDQLTEVCVGEKRWAYFIAAAVD